jgi:hypothetical protein
MVNWLTVILSALGGAAGAALLLTTLWKTLGSIWTDRLRLQLQHENDEKIEKLRAALQAQTDRTQKLLDASVQKAVLVTRTRFETEFNAYKEIYPALCEVKHTIGQTRPLFAVVPAEETNEERRKRLSVALCELMAAHNKAITLKDNLAPFYAPEVYTMLDECLKASGLEIMDVQIAGGDAFAFDWYEKGAMRQDAFNEAFYKVGTLIRERIASLGILPQ